MRSSKAKGWSGLTAMVLIGVPVLGKAVSGQPTTGRPYRSNHFRSPIIRPSCGAWASVLAACSRTASPSPAMSGACTSRCETVRIDDLVIGIFGDTGGMSPLYPWG